jgi:hypothetical protein
METECQGTQAGDKERRELLVRAAKIAIAAPAAATLLLAATTDRAQAYGGITY